MTLSSLRPFPLKIKEKGKRRIGRILGTFQIFFKIQREKPPNSAWPFQFFKDKTDRPWTEMK